MDEALTNIQLNSQVLNELQNVLKIKGYRTVILQSEQEVIDYIHSIPNDVIIGLGDSITTCTLKIRNILARKGSLIYYAWNGDRNYNRAIETFESHPTPEYYLTRINAITTNGNILIKDYSKKALADKYFPKHMIAFAGSKRVVEEFSNLPSLHKYAIFREKPETVDFTVVLLPFMVY